MKAAIIEDEKTHRDLLSSYIEAWGKKIKNSVFIKEYENSASFLFDWEDLEFDILFLDIQMPGILSNCCDDCKRRKPVSW